MKLSQLIGQLTTIALAHGDMEVSIRKELADFDDTRQIKDVDTWQYDPYDSDEKAKRYCVIEMAI